MNKDRLMTYVFFAFITMLMGLTIVQAQDNAEARTDLIFTATHITKPLPNSVEWDEWKPVTSEITFQYDGLKTAWLNAVDAATKKTVTKKFLFKDIGEDPDNPCEGCFLIRALDNSDYSSLTIQMEIPEDGQVEALIVFTYDDYWDLDDKYKGTHAYALSMVPKIP